MVWNISPRQAIELQKELHTKIITRDDFQKIERIAGSDISIPKNSNIGFAGVIVYEYPSLKEIERVWVKGELKFPYIPGLLSFREAPLLLEAFAKLKNRPDLAVFDGQGIAHPRRFGVASHMGLLLGIPTIGCAKSLLIGKYKEPSKKKGSYTDIIDNGEVVGAALRTRDSTKPVFISVGHKISLSKVIEIIMRSSPRYRIPVPTRDAHIFVKKLATNLAPCR